MKEILPQQLAGNRAEYLILDVREPEEIERASLPGTLNIPMNEVPARLDEIPRDRPIAVLCHHGARSAQIALFLESEGIPAFNVAGGIDAWSQRVDHGVPRY